MYWGSDRAIKRERPFVHVEIQLQFLGSTRFAAATTAEQNTIVYMHADQSAAGYVDCKKDNTDDYWAPSFVYYQPALMPAEFGYQFRQIIPL